MNKVAHTATSSSLKHVQLYATFTKHNEAGSKQMPFREKFSPKITNSLFTKNQLWQKYRSHLIVTMDQRDKVYPFFGNELSKYQYIGAVY